MAHVAPEELPSVSEAAYAVAQEAREAILDVPSRQAAQEWAAKLAAACRCAQEVWEFMPDPAVGN